MEQFVTIFVICGRAGRDLFEQAETRLTSEGMNWDRDAMIAAGQLAYWSQQLDLWSMGDSFGKFIRSPEKRAFSSGSHQLICCRREGSEVQGQAANEEEKRLKEILLQAFRAYHEASTESYLFLVRSVIDTSKGFNPNAQQGVAPQSATRSELDSEGSDKPQIESEARSR